jgi:hypothetical protein
MFSYLRLLPEMRPRDNAGHCSISSAAAGTPGAQPENDGTVLVYSAILKK